MKYRLTQLATDVMARLGEIARPQSSVGATDVPWPEDIIALKVRSMLGEAGRRVIIGSEAVGSSGSESVEASGSEVVVMRLMPCGLYCAEVRLPEGFLRLASVKMAEWRRSVADLTAPESAEWTRQWSPEPGIAGCPQRPRAYLDRGADGLLLRLIGSESEEDLPEWICIVCVPVVDEAGEFDFPGSLYPGLVGNIARSLSE